MPGSRGRSLKRAGLAGAGLAALVGGGIAVQHALARRYEKGPDRASVADLAAPPGLESIDVPVSDGGSIGVVACGAGRPFVMLHGITLSSAVWHYQMRDLASAGYRVVAMDFRGHGRSVAGSDGLSMERLALDVDEVLAALGVEGAVLVGHSMGGMVALKLLARSPALAGGVISGLGLVATSASPARHRGMPAAKGLVAATRPLFARGAGMAARLPGPTLPAHDLAFLLARITFGDQPSPRLVDFTGQLTSQVALRVSAGLILEIAMIDLEATLPQIRVPTSMIVGDHDLMTPVADARDIAAAIPNAELVVLEGCGHMVMLERREELCSALLGLAGRALVAGEHRTGVL